MSITQTTPQHQIEVFLDQQIRQTQAAIINALEYVGVTCINEARTNGAYRDRTGNLRSSVGYVIVKDGTVVSGSSFEQTKGGQTGQTYIKELAAKFPHGIALIVVAGMKYASHVEALNLNVLTSAELLAQSLVPALLTKLGLKTAA